MKKPITIGLAVAAAVLALVGCSTNERETERQPSPAAGQQATVASKPAAVVSNAAAQLQKQSFKMTMTSDSGVRMTGVMNPAAETGAFTIGAGTDTSVVHTEMRFIGGITYIKTVMSGSTAPGMGGKTWRRLNSSTPGSGQYMFGNGGIAGPLEHAAEVRRVSDTRYTGNLDLAKSGAALGIPSAALDQLATTKVPFEATLDDQGRLTRYTFTTPAVGSQRAERLDLTFSDFGTRVDVQAPPPDQIAPKPAR